MHKDVFWYIYVTMVDTNRDHPSLPLFLLIYTLGIIMWPLPFSPSDELSDMQTWVYCFCFYFLSTKAGFRCVRKNRQWKTYNHCMVICFSNMYAELTCDCDVVWLIRRLKSKSNRDRFFDYEALLCKSSKKRKVKIEVTKLTENDVCPQKGW